MALNPSNINYGGKELGMEIQRDLFTTNVLQEVFGARMIPSIKSKGVWHDAKINGVLHQGPSENNSALTCPAFDSDFTLVQNTVNMCRYSLSGKITHDSLEATYRELQYKIGIMNESVVDDTELFAAITMMITDLVAAFQGDAFLNNVFIAPGDCDNGLLAMFEDTGLSRPVPAGQKLTAVAITPVNVQAEMSKVINALPSKYRYGKLAKGLSKPKFAVSGSIMDAYTQSVIFQASTNSGGAMGLDPTISTYRGYEIVVVDDLIAGHMFFTAPDNIGIIWDSENDITNLLVRNALDDSNMCAEIRWRLDWRAGIIFGDGTKIVTYR